MKHFFKNPPILLSDHGQDHPGGHRGGFLKIISIAIPTYTGAKISFNADIGPRNQFPCQHQPQKPVSMPTSALETSFPADVSPRNKFPCRHQPQKPVSQLTSALETGFRAGAGRKFRRKQCLKTPRSEVTCVMFAMHRNPALFPEPDRFDPERFSPAAPAAANGNRFLRHFWPTFHLGRFVARPAADATFRRYLQGKLQGLTFFKSTTWRGYKKVKGQR